MNAEMPSAPLSAGSVRAITVKMPASGALVMIALGAVRARNDRRRAARSSQATPHPSPDPGSVSANDATIFAGREARQPARLLLRRAVDDDALRADAVVGAEQRTKRGRGPPELEARRRPPLPSSGRGRRIPRESTGRRGRAPSFPRRGRRESRRFPRPALRWEPAARARSARRCRPARPAYRRLGSWAARSVSCGGGIASPRHGIAT